MGLPNVKGQRIPVAKPLMPDASRLLPYLQQIDQSRIYSNFGPLARRLEARLAAHYRMSTGSVLTVANATLGLALALQALEARKGTFCLLPAWTFAASAHAVVAAGLKPYFVDVDPESWALSPHGVLCAIDGIPPRQVGAVMPVAPFGRPIDVAAWDRFAERTRIPVVIDAAAGFDGLRPGIVPAVVSLHATKVLGAGEGGFVVTRDAHVITEIQRRSNFGFSGTREARVPSTNAKMSEYSAAVALASLDAWEDTRARFQAVAMAYQDAMSVIPGVELQGGYGTDWVSATCIARFVSPDPLVETVANKLALLGIDTRRWWPRVLPEENAFARFSHDAMRASVGLANATLGLPCYIDLPDVHVALISDAIGSFVHAAPGHTRKSEPSVRPKRHKPAAIAAMAL
jgi:dTDP-4-amino-4,6-dideoxygalactose transaminase